MGLLLSRLTSTGEISWYYLLSLLQVEYRRWFYVSFMRRSQRSRSSSNASSENDRMVSTEHVSTQTPRHFTCDTRIDVSPDRGSDPSLTRGERTERERAERERTERERTERERTERETGHCGHLYTPPRGHEGCSKSRDVSYHGGTSSDYSDICIFENPDFSQFGRLYEHLASPRDRLTGLQAPRGRRISALSPVREEGDPGCVSSRHADTTLTGGQRCGRGQSDTHFEQSVAVEGETHRGCGGGWSGDCHSSGTRTVCCSFSSDSGLSEGLGEGLSEGLNERLSERLNAGLREGLSEGLNEGLGEGLSEGLNEGLSEGLRLSEGLGEGLGEGFSEGLNEGMNERLNEGLGEGLSRSHDASLWDSGAGDWSRARWAASISTDSGLGEERHRSANSSLSDGACLSASLSSDCDASAAHSAHTCSVRHDHDHTDDCEVSANDVFSAEDSHTECLERTVREDEQAKDPFNEGIIAEHSPTTVRKDSDSGVRRTRPTLAPLVIKARRRVLFSSGTSSTSPSPSSSPSSASTTSSAFARCFRPLYSRQNSGESTASSCSVDSASAVPLSPLTPDPACRAPRLFPGREKHYFSDPAEGRDLVVTAEGERFHVHSSILAWHCPALCLQLRTTQSREVVLLDTRAEHVLSLLYLLYPFEGQVITANNVEGLLDLARCLACERVSSACRSYLIGLTHFPDLCPHGQQRHQAAKGSDPADGSDGGDSVSGMSIDISDTTDPASPPSDDRTHSHVASGQSHARQNAEFWCACAETMADRVVDVLQMCVKYDLHDVYCVYVDVAASMRTEELTTCTRFDHLSTATREDVLRARIERLERVVSNVSVTESALTACTRGRHHSHRLTFHGELCLRCMSKNLLREARHSV